MFNPTAQKVFDENIERALAMPPGELVGTEAGWPPLLAWLATRCIAAISPMARPS